jgi:hypothetical protein
MDCTKCGGELFRISGLCTDRDNMREDAYCAECNTRYGVRSHGLELISEAVDMSAVAKENSELKITIKNMLKINSDNTTETSKE